ncbi:hypothetical protein ANCCAN_23939 [Ancylostoma caninum]|uniref:Uncharacterized protein n=1 Tax=Ancylostoma caninum TaxID=29170 RepID=A0A368FJE2_ANCCA|nr:hypothetical protein ANCCAN_23939 [Ancylostoma caninum]
MHSEESALCGTSLFVWRWGLWDTVRVSSRKTQTVSLAAVPATLTLTPVVVKEDFNDDTVRAAMDHLLLESSGGQ